MPTGTIVDRDYATFVSRYNTDSGRVTAIRHINFFHRQVAADRVPDYAAFLHAVQTDQAQLFTLTRARRFVNDRGQHTTKALIVS